jgi:hypothetical protein
MLLTITCTAERATDPGYLLYKHPDNLFEKEMWFGRVFVFYPEADDHRCTAALLLDVDPVALVRARAASSSQRRTRSITRSGPRFPRGFPPS